MAHCSCNVAAHQFARSRLMMGIKAMRCGSNVKVEITLTLPPATVVSTLPIASMAGWVSAPIMLGMKSDSLNELTSPAIVMFNVNL